MGVDIAWENNGLLRISDNETEAFLTLYHPEKEDYQLQDILDFLSMSGITYGVFESEIRKMIEEQDYYREIVAACGKCSIDGIDGFYEYCFETSPSKKPIIMEDGSVDYNTLGQMALCEKNQLLAIYHKAKPGLEGITVYGNTMKSKMGSEAARLKGKGFYTEEEDTKYYASFEGKIELLQGTLTITPIFVVKEDADATTGDIRFNGDILVLGNVFSGVTLEATGNITVNGHVENAVLKAGKDVVLQNGMQGAKKGIILAKGNVSAKFFEQATVAAKGNINANTILNCNVSSDKEIVVSGKRGAIIGGITKAIENITASMIGNKALIFTQIFLGTSTSFKKDLIETDKKIKNYKQEKGELEKNIKRLEGIIKIQSNMQLEKVRNGLLKSMIEISQSISIEQDRRKDILDEKERAVNGKIVVIRGLYPNVMLSINGIFMEVKDFCNDVMLKEEKGEIHIYSNR